MTASLSPALDLPSAAEVDRALPRRPGGESGPPDLETWRHFPVSFAETALEMKELCAPSIITWLPRGTHCARPLPKGELVVVTAKPQIAEVADGQLQRMRARTAAGQGPSPILDYRHEGGVAGWPLEFFWDALRGVQLSVRWSPEAEAAIVHHGRLGFSPMWIDGAGKFFGLAASVGGLLGPGERSAVERMPPVRALTKWRELELKGERFLHLVDWRRINKRELSVLAAWEEVGLEWPELLASYQLRAAILDEMKDLPRL